MASLRKIPGRKVWIACFTDVTGNRRQRSTGSRDRAAAVKIAQEFEAASRRKRTARQVREVITQLHEEITGEGVPQATVSDFINEWLLQKETTTAAATIASYRKGIAKFLNFLGPDSEREISEITRDHFVRFRNLQAATLAPRTVNRDLKCLKSIFRAARRDGVLVEDPSEFVETVRLEGDKESRPFSIAELKAVLAVAGPEWTSMVLFGLYTGQRLGDIAMLTWSNVDLAHGHLRLQTRKTRKLLNLPLAPSLRRHLEALAHENKGSNPLHPYAHSVLLRENRTGSLSNQFATILARAGLRERKSHHARKKGGGRSTRRERNSLSFHTLRRTATTLLHEAGVPSAVAEALIGHDSSEVHQTYVSVGFNALQQAAAALPEILSEKS